jgi:predicted dehydrogenase
MKQLNVGIVGTGWVSGEHIAAFGGNPHTKVVALCGRTKEGAVAKAAETNLDCTIYTDYIAMLAHPELDVVSIATPPNLHAEQAVAAAQAGKHLLLEKAMANTLEDIRAIRDAVTEAKVKSVVSFVLRWNPLFEIIKTQLANESLGRLFYGEVDYFHGIGPWYGQYSWNIRKDMGGSSLLSAGCHALDALRWFMGGTIVEVTQYRTRGDGADFKDYEYDPTTVTICKFEDGRIGKVTSCIECIQPYVFNINLVGTEGTFRNNKVYSPKNYPGQTDWVEIPTILPDSGDVTEHPFQHEVDHLVECIQQDVESHVNIADAYITHEIVLAADRSGIEGKSVSLPLA